LSVKLLTKTKIVEAPTGRIQRPRVKSEDDTKPQAAKMQSSISCNECRSLRSELRSLRSKLEESEALALKLKRDSKTLSKIRGALSDDEW
jgi:hypothetical protein